MRSLAVHWLDRHTLCVTVLSAAVMGGPLGATNAVTADDPPQPVQIRSPVRVRISDGPLPIRPPTPTPTATTPAPGAKLEAAPPAPRIEPAAAPEPALQKPVANPLHRKDDAVVNPRPASFRDITPGSTKMAEVQSLLGKADADVRLKNETTLTYKIGPFPKVEITVVDEVVRSILIHLKAPTPLAEIARDLDLTAFEPVPVPDASGEILGQAYPDRGILLNFGMRGRDPQVAHIALEEITAEPFILRAEHSAPPHVTRALADLKHAQRLDPQDARSFGLRATLLAALGQPTEALAAAHEAVRLDPENSDYRLTQARRYADTGQFVRAIKDTKAILERPNLRPELQAAAECQLGDLLATGPSSDYQQSVEHHLTAIKLATTIAHDPHPAVRRSAKQILLAAHLRVAHEIAAGNWQRKSEVVSQWLANADRIARDLVEQEGAPELVRFAAHRQSLAVAAVFGSGVDMTALAEPTLERGRQLVAQAADPLFKQQLEWELGEAYVSSMRISQRLGKQDEALQHAAHAVALLESAANGRESGPAVNQPLGRLYFAIGAIHAVAQNDHAGAVRWYEKALPRFAEPPAESPLAELGEHGERLVSMGVSFWQVEQRELGMRLTKQGAQLIQRAVKNGTLDEKSLAVPYGNLAVMHEQLGNAEEAQSFQTLAAKIESPDKQPKQR